MKPYKLKTSHPVLLGCALIMLCAPEAVAYEQKVQGGTSNDCFTSVCVTKDKGFAIAGWTESNGAGGKDAWVQKYDKNQTLQWERYYGGTGDEEIAQLVEDVDGSLLFCGYTTSKGNGGKDAWVVKLAKNGKLKWDKTVGGALDDEAITLSVKKEDMVTQHGYFIAINTLSREKADSTYKPASSAKKEIFYVNFCMERPGTTELMSLRLAGMDLKWPDAVCCLIPFIIGF